MKQPVYIVDGARTPFIKARGRPGPFTPVDLAVQCGRPLLLRHPTLVDAIDQVILGCVNVIADEVNPARVAALRLGLGEENRVHGADQLRLRHAVDRHGLSLHPGRGSRRHSRRRRRGAVAFPARLAAAVDWFGRFSAAKAIWDKAKRLGELRPRFMKPIIGLERGLTDPIVGLNMGQTAEVLAHLFAISRHDADRYAVESHRRLAHAQEAGLLMGEVVPMTDRDGKLYEKDDGVRPDTSVEKLAALSAAFEKPYGKVTPGNSSQITDGASWVIVASEAAAEHKLDPLARIVDSEWSALDPSIMGLAPTLCATALLERNGLAREEVELWEINEAFAAQILACLVAWEDESYCKSVLGLQTPFGRIERDRLNVDGGPSASVTRSAPAATASRCISPKR